MAGNLGDPGVWVDPDVKELTPAEVAELDAAAKSAAAPIRIAVIPAAKINTSDSDYFVELAWEASVDAATISSSRSGRPLRRSWPTARRA